MNTRLHGFTEIRQAPLSELDATLHEMEHAQTGARLVWLERDEENKTFGIAFPTLPKDDTGVFHILEHSVLCGSDRYPVKEPFVELLKHSMNTFLNALTFPDKTLYPISSRNPKDFLTLMRVYLDAVFHPAIYHNPAIFRQEGWRYEFDADGQPHYKGVVFNEMKGAFADADELETNALNRALFPNTPYRFVSGGDPACIPDLTYEQFLAAHRKFYAPSNALIFLDGTVDLHAENAAAAEQAVLDELRRLAEQGIDRAKLEAALARREFEMRERDFGSYPPGIVFCMQALESWLYGGRPEANLQVGALFDSLRAKMQGGYFEDLLRRIFLENPHKAKVVLTPSHTAGEARRRTEADRLAREAAAWTEADRTALQQEQQELDAWQQTPDSPEALATLPSLTLADLPAAPTDLPLETATWAGIPVLRHRVKTRGIVYVTFYLDADGLRPEQMSELGYLCQLLGHLPTRHYTAEQLNDRIRLTCGELRFYATAYAIPGETDRCHVKLCLSLSALEPKLDAALDLAAEVLTTTDLSAEPAARDILRQLRTQRMQNCIMAGHNVGIGRLAAQFSAAGAAQEYLTGFAGYQWVKAREDHWDWAALRPALQSLLDAIACKARLTLAVTTDHDLAGQAAARLAAALPEGAAAPEATALAPWGVRREGIAIPADIAFACCGGNVLAGGQPYTGAWQLASKLLGLEYLWNAVRVQGGAYGTGLAVRDTGLAACWSYRDPRGVQSLETYSRCADFLRQFCRESRDLTGLIIGAVSDSEPLLSPQAQGTTADTWYWQGVDYAERCRRRKALLSATPDTLLALADALETALQGGVCVVGGRPQLEACGLDSIESV